MANTKDRSEKILNTSTKIMLAVWELTDHDPVLYVSCSEIADQIQEQFGKRPSDEWVCKVIRRMQKPKLPYDTFKIEGRHNHSIGRDENTYRLHPDTVGYPETSFILGDLRRRGRGHRVPVMVLEETIKAGKKYGLTSKNVHRRIEEAIRVGYLQETDEEEDIEPCYKFVDRFSREKDYLDELAKKLAPTLLPKQPPPKRIKSVRKRKNL